MDKFSIALIIGAVAILAYYYYTQYQSWKTTQAQLTWPREYSDCPDYWNSNGEHVCENTFNLGSCPMGRTGPEPQGTVDFKSIVGGVPSNKDETALRKQMTTENALLKKCRWAKQCNATWEGVDKLCA